MLKYVGISCFLFGCSDRIQSVASYSGSSSFVRSSAASQLDFCSRRFGQALHSTGATQIRSPHINSSNSLVMRVKRKSSRTKHIAGSSVVQANYDRVKSAGRKGTKKFVDPNKVFVGNLSYSVTSEDLAKWFDNLGLGEQLISCKVRVQ